MERTCIMYSTLNKGYLTLQLEREYLPHGTNGTLYLYGKPICHTIELPWRDNRRNVSCIPEGRYRLVRSLGRRFHYCIRLLDVPGRSGILIHPANDAATELRGCIAPVTTHTGAGKGVYSRVAMERVEDVVYPVLAEGEDVWLEVLSVDHSATGNFVR
ncbi:DUF5675 family protein [Parapedobacter soli]|uniref:DUF5675 family protein n=1 Tax=Parapedobacter soli TaxID=416955 RepID=UPI0021C58955|nr:DUF5675 family protein [Parapedobacter soli]